MYIIIEHYLEGKTREPSDNMVKIGTKEDLHKYLLSYYDNLKEVSVDCLKDSPLFETLYLPSFNSIQRIILEEEIIIRDKIGGLYKSINHILKKIRRDIEAIILERDLYLTSITIIEGEILDENFD
jgi:hypothetical protein